MKTILGREENLQVIGDELLKKLIALNRSEN